MRGLAASDYPVSVVALLVGLLAAAVPELGFEPAGPVVRAPGSTSGVMLASGADVTLAVWEAHGRLGVSRPVVFAGRLDSTGASLDPEGLRISPRFGAAPHVAYLPQPRAFAVVWEDEGDTWLRLVSPDGRAHPATEPPLRVGVGRRPFVTATMTGFLVTAEAGTPVAWRFGLPARQLDASPLVLGGSVSWATPVRAVAAAADGAIIVWPSGLTLHAVWMSMNLAGPPLRNVGPLVTAGGQVTLDGLVDLGPMALAVWRQEDTRETTVHTRHFDPNNLEAPGGLDAGAAEVDAFAVPGDGYAVVTTAGSGSAAAFVVSDAGAVAVQRVADRANRVAGVVADPTLPAPVHLVQTSWNEGVLARTASLALVPIGAEVQLGNARGAHLRAQVAAVPTGFVNVWHRLTGDAELVVWRSFLDGGAATSPELVMPSSRFDEPALQATAGGAALLVEGRLRLLGSELTWGPPVALPRALDYAALSADRSGQLVVVGSVPREVNTYEARALRYLHDGGVTERLVLPRSPRKPLHPRLAFARDGGGALVLINPNELVWANRLSADLTPLDDAGFPVTTTRAAGARVASDPEDGYVVVSSNGADVEARRVTAAGVTPPLQVLPGPWDVWSVEELPTGVLVVGSSRATGEVVAVEVAVQSGAMRVGVPVRVGEPGEPTHGARAAIGPGGLSFVYGRVDRDAGVATTRYQVWPFATGAACTQRWECGRGDCVANHCDLGALDAGEPDAGAQAPGGPDAGGAPTGEPGEGERTPGRYRAGCDCQEVGGASMLWLAALLTGRRRRAG